MGIVYKAECADCGYYTYLGETISAILREDGQMRVLPHPVESYVLAEEGLTLGTASLQGRHVDCHILLCRACGCVYERRVITTPGVGCIVALMTAATITIWCLFAGFREVSPLVGAAGGYGIRFVLDVCGDPLARWAAARNGYSVQDVPCRCDRPSFRKLVAPHMTFGRPFPCPQCTQGKLYCREDGIS